KNLSAMAEEMFNQEYNYHSLYRLNPHFKQQIEQMHYITLPYIYKLNIIVEFITSVYKTKIEPVMSRILNDGDFKKEKTRNDITSYYYLLSNYEQRIREYDEKFNPNKDEGKLLYQLQQQSGKNETATAKFVDMIDKINQDSQNFITEIQQSFKHIYDFLISVNDVHNPHNVPIINTDKIKVPSQPNLFVAVERAITLFNKFNNMLDLVNDVYK
ncbi:MAG: hypothetical protein J6Y01_00755, partial [Spirochaetales bacterium]|nr:hypothetical protein [Spirochaetales bacterium]